MLQVTVYRLWVMDGRYHLLALQGRTLPPKRHLLGNNGLVEFTGQGDLRVEFDRWLERGFPHHVCVVQGYHADTIKQFARDHGVQCVN